jgi:regulator of protease activity HflC (stomatin/prohibitin superfamily)
MTSTELNRSAGNGYLMLFVGILFLLGAIASLVMGIRTENPMWIITIVGGVLLGALTLIGLFIVNPNDARVLVLFGTYKGTVRENGFYWANPFLVKKKITLRARNLNGDRIKVNDKTGNPIEIAAVVVWQVLDTYKAFFEVDDYEHYVVVQSEAAVRHLAGSYPYDTMEDDQEEMLTLRAGTEQVAGVLEQELSERFARAGIKVIEARISHLAYAPEIAEAMLRRQQASAVVAARTLIVHGAVSMVEMALEKLKEKHVVELVLCSETSASPVVNTGTLYQ